MGARGKKSSASLSVISSEVSAIKRLEPPNTLGREEAEIWVAVVNRMPAEWLQDETIGLLKQYCRHFVMADRVSAMIQEYERSDEFYVKDYARLGRMQKLESDAIDRLGRSMRLNPQSTITNQRKSKDPKPKRPWDN